MQAEASAGGDEEVAWSERGGRVPSADLAVTVIRLLVIAMDEIQHHHAIVATATEHVPNYRAWPSLELPQRTGPGTISFYVCPKGVLTSDERPFPVGTQFVMEILGDRGMDVFVMKKYAALNFSERTIRDREVWMSVCCRLENAGLSCGRARQ